MKSFPKVYGSASITTCVASPEFLNLNQVLVRERDKFVRLIQASEAPKTPALFGSFICQRAWNLTGQLKVTRNPVVDLRLSCPRVLFLDSCRRFGECVAQGVRQMAIGASNGPSSATLKPSF